MRILILLLSIFTFKVAYAQDTELNWLTDLDKAKYIAKKEEKPILMYFTGSDWCGPCKMLKKDFFNTDRFHKQSKGLVLVMVDIPRRLDILTREQRQYNIELMGKYNQKGLFPTVLQLDVKGNIKNTINSYSGSPQLYFDFVDKML